MSASATDFARHAAKTALNYLLLALLCILLGAVYELFSHEVYSFWMIYAFVFPLAGGTLPFLLMLLRPRRWYPGAVGRKLYHSGIATLTVGSIMQGILEIYGTTNRLTRMYGYVGVPLLIAGIVLALIRPASAGRSMRKRL